MNLIIYTKGSFIELGLFFSLVNVPFVVVIGCYPDQVRGDFQESVLNEKDKITK